MFAILFHLWTWHRILSGLKTDPALPGFRLPSFYFL